MLLSNPRLPELLRAEFADLRKHWPREQPIPANYVDIFISLLFAILIEQFSSHCTGGRYPAHDRLYSRMS